MFKSFDTLKNGENAVFAQCENLESKIVIRDESDNKFKVFNDFYAFQTWYNALTNKTAHEVIFGPQRLKLDIDMKLSELVDINKIKVFNGDGIDSKINEFLESLIIVIKETFKDLWPSEGALLAEDIMIFESCGRIENDYKFSYHVQLPYHIVHDHIDAKGFAEEIIKRLGITFGKFIDLLPYGEVHNLRLYDSVKEGRKKLINQDLAAEHKTISEISDEFKLIRAPIASNILPKKFYKEEKPQTTVKTIIVQKALEMVQNSGIDSGLKFTSISNGLLLYKRINKSYCRICKEDHSKDNTLMVGIYENEDKSYNVVQHCRHNANSIPLGQIMNDEVEARKTDFLHKVIDNAAITASKITNKFHDLPADQKMIYEEERLRPFDLTKPTYVIHAPMGMGKTNELINEFSKINETSIQVFISFRKTFTGNISQRFNNFVSYDDIDGDISLDIYPKLIIQVESLWRIKLPMKFDSNRCTFDYIILDECESIFAQLSSDLSKNFIGCFSMFQLMLKSANHVVAMDANISDRTYNILEQLRQKPMYYHNNTYKRNLDNKYHFTLSKTTFTRKIIDSLDKRIVIATNSLIDGKAYEELIKEHAPNKRVMFYSSETPMTIKKRDFENVNACWLQYDIIIYTPSLTAGVSFEQSHFDIFFGSFNSMSCNVETCRQMIGRVRNFSTNDFYILLSGAPLAVPVNVEDIKQVIFNQRNSIFNAYNIDRSGLSYKYDSDGEKHYQESDYFQVWLENEAINNKSKHDFTRRFISQVAATGAQIDYIETAAGENALSNFTKIVRDIDAKNIASAADLSEEELHKLLDKRQKDLDILPEERHSINKAIFRKQFAFTGEITESIVKSYKTPKVLKTFNLLREITQCASIQESINLCRHNQYELYSYTKDHPNSRIEAFGLNHNNIVYSIHLHEKAYKILTICGFKCIMDYERYILPEIMDENFKVARLTIQDNQMEYSMLFNFETKYVDDSQKLVNKVLDVYGRRIILIEGFYMLRNTIIGNLFQNDDPMHPSIHSKLEFNYTLHDRYDIFLRALPSCDFE